MISWPHLPYELIGKAVVAGVALLAGLILVGVVLLSFLFVWVRGWKWLANRMWDGYDPEERRPPLWKMRISWVAFAFARFEFRKLPAVWREASELAGDDVTARDALHSGLEELFVDDD